MLTLKQIRENKQFVAERLQVKGVDAISMLDEIIAIDEKRKAFQNDLDSANSELNSIAKEVGQLFKLGKQEEANKLKIRTTELKDVAKRCEEKMNEAIASLNALIVTLPNLPHISVPHGKTAADNHIERLGGKEVKLYEGALPHWELAKKYDIID
ncbi:MAG: serine--tRNA ligase, partial [Rikenellaceae bacterium]